MNPTLEEIKEKYFIGCMFLTAHTQKLCTVVEDDQHLGNGSQYYLSYGNRSKNGHDHTELLWCFKKGFAHRLTEEEVLAEVVKRYPIGTEYYPIRIDNYKNNYKNITIAKVERSPIAITVITPTRIEVGYGCVYVNGVWAEKVIDSKNIKIETPVPELNLGLKTTSKPKFNIGDKVVTTGLGWAWCNKEDFEKQVQGSKMNNPKKIKDIYFSRKMQEYCYSMSGYRNWETESNFKFFNPAELTIKNRTSNTPVWQSRDYILGITAYKYGQSLTKNKNNLKEFPIVPVKNRK